jgi:hypothetical protein
LNGLMFMRFFGVPNFITVYLWLAISHHGLWESPKIFGSYNPIYPLKLGAERCHWPLGEVIINSLEDYVCVRISAPTTEGQFFYWPSHFGGPNFDPYWQTSHKFTAL